MKLSTYHCSHHYHLRYTHPLLPVEEERCAQVAHALSIQPPPHARVALVQDETEMLSRDEGVGSQAIGSCLPSFKNKHYSTYPVPGPLSVYLFLLLTKRMGSLQQCKAHKASSKIKYRNSNLIWLGLDLTRLRLSFDGCFHFFFFEAFASLE